MSSFKVNASELEARYAQMVLEMSFQVKLSAAKDDFHNLSECNLFWMRYCSRRSLFLSGIRQTKKERKLCRISHSMSTGSDVYGGIESEGDVEYCTGDATTSCTGGEALDSTGTTSLCPDRTPTQNTETTTVLHSALERTRITGTILSVRNGDRWVGTIQKK